MDKKKQKITAGRECDQVSAGELRDAVCRKLRITPDGTEAFSIWICSPLLREFIFFLYTHSIRSY